MNDRTNPTQPNEPIDERSDEPIARHDDRAEWPDGPMGRNASTEAVGDPESEDVECGTERGAAAGAVAGTAVAGPAGLVAGAAVGAAAGAAHEEADEDQSPERDYVPDDPLIWPGSTGTGPTDPLYDRSQPNDDPYAPGGRG